MILDGSQQLALKHFLCLSMRNVTLSGQNSGLTVLFGSDVPQRPVASITLFREMIYGLFQETGYLIRAIVVRGNILTLPHLALTNLIFCFLLMRLKLYR